MRKRLFFFVFPLIFSRVFAQQFNWAKSANGNGIDEGIAVSTDASGNVLMTGQFTSSVITFGSYTLTGSGNGSNVFVAKYNAAGNELWVRSSISSLQDY